MRVRIMNFRLIENEWVKEKRVIARFTAQLDHFRLYELKLMDCPEKGFVVWATRYVRLSMAGRERIMEKVLVKYAEACEA